MTKTIPCSILAVVLLVSLCAASAGMQAFEQATKGEKIIRSIENDLPSDKKATKETIRLYKNLKKLVNKGVMFGHQDDLAYGVNWKYIPGKSDVKDVTGDYPALYGWDISKLELKQPLNIDGIPFDKMKRYIQEAYGRGQVITISWHAGNPLTGGSAWDTTHAVASILPGGSKHDLYKVWLDIAAGYMQDLRGMKNELIPVLFRPFHELTGHWFWWCQNTCTPDEFKNLWRFTVDYLRNEKNVHNLLMVYNTASFNSKQHFLERYPGDEYVDFVSFDSYQYNDPLKDSSFLKSIKKQLNVVCDVAREKNKIPAFAETGYEAIPYAEWWTKTLWPAISDCKISYVMLWRNEGYMPGSKKYHYYVPYPGDKSAEDFKKFYALPQTLFGRDVSKEKVYR